MPRSAYDYNCMDTIVIVNHQMFSRKLKFSWRFSFADFRLVYGSVTPVLKDLLLCKDCLNWNLKHFTISRKAKKLWNKWSEMLRLWKVKTWYVKIVLCAEVICQYCVKWRNDKLRLCKVNKLYSKRDCLYRNIMLKIMIRELSGGRT